MADKPAERGEPIPGVVAGFEIGDRIEFLPTTEQAMSGREIRGTVERIFGGKHATIHVALEPSGRVTLVAANGDRAAQSIRKLGDDE